MPDPESLVSVCMATFEPDIAMFERQVATLRDQTHRNWVCVISDDASSPERFAQIERVVGDDQRFTVSRGFRRLGFYRNFERALAMAVPDARFVAFADQDDRWDPDKLATLLASIGRAQLVYSDARASKPDGTVISRTLWRRRRNNHTNLASLMLANTVTGAASMFRRELLDLVLPFPDAPGTPYHDHWTALVALATGELVYVDRPMFDYVQHPEAALGHEAIEARPRLGRLQRLRRLVRDPAGARGRWREAYVEEWCRIAVFARTLESRCGARLAASKRRALARFVAEDPPLRTLAWLVARPARALVGHNETRGFEYRLARGLLWRRLALLSSRLSR